jgi:hypothetical protein
MTYPPPRSPGYSVPRCVERHRRDQLVGCAVAKPLLKPVHGHKRTALYQTVTHRAFLNAFGFQGEAIRCERERRGDGRFDFINFVQQAVELDALFAREVAALEVGRLLDRPYLLGKSRQVVVDLHSLVGQPPVRVSCRPAVRCESGPRFYALAFYLDPSPARERTEIHGRSSGSSFPRNARAITSFSPFPWPSCF